MFLHRKFTSNIEHIAVLKIKEFTCVMAGCGYNPVTSVANFKMEDIFLWNRVIALVWFHCIFDCSLSEFCIIYFSWVMEVECVIFMLKIQGKFKRIFSLVECGNTEDTGFSEI